MAKPKFPKKLGEAIDMGRQLEQARLSYQKEAEARLSEMKAAEKAIDEHVLQLLEAQGMDKGAGSEASVSISKQPIPRVTNWDAFYAHVKKTGEFDLLERRPAKAAFKARLEALAEKQKQSDLTKVSGVAVPGIETYWDKKLFYSKLPTK